MEMAEAASRRDYFDAYARKFDRQTTAIAAFRLALFTLRWIGGLSSSQMNGALIPQNHKERSNRRFMGKPRFFEMISYGLSFVGTLVRTEHESVRLRNARIALQLRKLAACTKLGFPPGGIALAQLVSRKITRKTAISAYTKIDGYRHILSYASDEDQFDDYFTKANIYNAFSDYHQEEIAQLADVWAERGRSDDDQVMGNLADMWTEFGNRFKTICLRENKPNREQSLRLTLRALFNGLDFKLDCAALGYGSATAISCPALELIEDGLRISYSSENEELQKRYESLILFAYYQDGELRNSSDQKIHTSVFTALKPDNVWVVLIEPPLTDWSSAKDSFVDRTRMGRENVRFLALDAFLVFLSSLIRGFVDTPHILIEDERLDTEVFLVERMAEYFNETIVGALQAVTLEHDSVWGIN